MLRCAVVDHDTLLTGGQWAPNPSGACPQEVRDGMYRLILVRTALWPLGASRALSLSACVQLSSGPPLRLACLNASCPPPLTFFLAPPQANEGPFRGKVREEVMPDDCEAVSRPACLPACLCLCLHHPPLPVCRKLPPPLSPTSFCCMPAQVAMAAERVQRELTAAFAPLLEAHGKVRGERLQAALLWRARRRLRLCCKSSCNAPPPFSWPDAKLAFSPPSPAASLQAGEPAKLRPSIFFDSANNALWLRVPKNSGGVGKGGGRAGPPFAGQLQPAAREAHPAKRFRCDSVGLRTWCSLHP